MGGTFTYNPSTGTLSATVFSGSGASLTSLNATNLSSGTVAAARMAPAQTAITSLINASLTQIGTAANQEYITFGTTNEVNIFVNNTEKMVKQELKGLKQIQD